MSGFLTSADDIKLLSRDKVSFSPDGNVRFDLTKTKNSSGPSQEVIFPQLVADPICPVTAVKFFLASRPTTLGSAPFFIDSLSEDVTPKRFTEILLRLALTRVGVQDALSFSSKSFRVGAASDAFALAIPTSSIQALGRWRSAAFMDYIHSVARALLASGVQTILAAHTEPSQTVASTPAVKHTQSFYSLMEMQSAPRPRPSSGVAWPVAHGATSLARPLSPVIGAYQRRISSFYAYRPAVARRRF